MKMEATRKALSLSELEACLDVYDLLKSNILDSDDKILIGL